MANTYSNTTYTIKFTFFGVRKVVSKTETTTLITGCELRRIYHTWDNQLNPFMQLKTVPLEVEPLEEANKATENTYINEGYKSAELDFSKNESEQAVDIQRSQMIMQKRSEKWLGGKFNTSVWRQIVKGTSRRYLSGKFVADEAKEDIDWEAFDKDNLEGDRLWDLQARHGTPVAGMINARELR